MVFTSRWSFIILLILTACGGGSTNDSTPIEIEPPVSTPTPEQDPLLSISTLFTKGPVADGMCELFAITNGIKANSIASANTNDEGLANFGDNISYRGYALIECQGGSYTDEFTERRNSDTTPLMRTVVNVEGEESALLQFVVSPLTEIAFLMAEHNEEPLEQVLTSLYYQQVSTAFGMMQGVDISLLAPTDLLNNVVAQDSAAAEYGFVLSLIAYLANNGETLGLTNTLNGLQSDLTSQIALNQSLFSTDMRTQIGSGIDHYMQFGSLINSALQATTIRRNLTETGDFILPEQPEIKTLSLTKTLDVIREELVDYIASNELKPLPDAPPVTDEMFVLGQALAFDKILSGNKDVSCISCHHPLLATGDQRSLPLGEGSEGLGQNRHGGRIIARHAQPLFNLDLFENMFWDGRVQLNDNNELSTPADRTGDLTPEMASVFYAQQNVDGFTGYGVVAAQAMFPVTDRLEMRGEPSPNNELAAFDQDDFTGIWTALMTRLGTIDEYVRLFEDAYPNVAFEQMTFAHAANAIAAFEIAAFNFRDNPWQQVIADVADNGEFNNTEVFDEQTTRGAHFFFETGCNNCHSGSVMSDFDFHAISTMQFGPGKGDGDSGFEDFGRERITGNTSDRAKFRTAPLFNIDLTAPYAHLGQFGDLWSHIQVYAIPERFWINLFSGYDQIIGGFVHQPDFENQITTNEKELFKAIPVPSFDGQAHGFIRTEAYNETKLSQVLAESNRLTQEEGKRLGDNELRLHRQILVPFMQAQTDPRARNLSRFIPESVPSGLPVENSL